MVLTRPRWSRSSGDFKKSFGHLWNGDLIWWAKWKRRILLRERSRETRWEEVKNRGRCIGKRRQRPINVSVVLGTTRWKEPTSPFLSLSRFFFNSNDVISLRIASILYIMKLSSISYATLINTTQTGDISHDHKRVALFAKVEWGWRLKQLCYIITKRFWIIYMLKKIDRNNICIVNNLHVVVYLTINNIAIAYLYIFIFLLCFM